MLYRFFRLSLILIFLSAGTGRVMAQNAAPSADPYTVSGVSVDAQGDTALAARKAAFAEARRKAYGMLGDRLLKPEERPNLVMPDDRVLAALVRDFEIVDEKMTSKRYVGTLDIRFLPAAVKRTMRVADTPQVQPGPDAAPQVDAAALPKDEDGTDAASRPATAFEDPENYIYSPAHKGLVQVNGSGTPTDPAVVAGKTTVLVLPWYGPVGRQTLWGDDNPWRSAWESNADLARDPVMPVVLPVGDVDDVRDYSPPQPLSRSVDMTTLMTRYHATQAVLAVAEQDSDGRLFVSLYQYEGSAPVAVGRFSLDAALSQAPFAEAVSKTVETLRGLPGFSSGVVAAKTGGVSAPIEASFSRPAPLAASRPYRVLARFSGLQQWITMRQSLMRADGVSSLRVRAISPAQANVDFSYDGDASALAAFLGQSGLDLQPAPAGAAQGGAAQYTLAYKAGY